MSKSGGGGNILFIIARSNISVKQFTMKQHVQCQLAITGILTISLGSIYFIIVITKKVSKFVKGKLKNALTKFFRIKITLIVKLFKSDEKVKFIPLEGGSKNNTIFNIKNWEPKK